MAINEILIQIQKICGFVTKKDPDQNRQNANAAAVMLLLLMNLWNAGLMMIAVAK